MTSPNISWSTDRDGVVTHMTQSGLSFFETIRSAVIGQSISHLLPDETKHHIVFKGEAYSGHFYRHGAKVFVQAIPVYDNGQVVGARFVASPTAPKMLHRTFWDGFCRLPLRGLYALSLLLTVGMVAAAYQGGVSGAFGASVGAVALCYGVGRWNALKSRLLEDMASARRNGRVFCLPSLPLSYRQSRSVTVAHRNCVFDLATTLQTEDDLGRSHSFERVIEKRDCPTAVTDSNFHIVRCNQAFASLFENSMAYFEGRPLSGLIPLSSVPLAEVSYDVEAKGRLFEMTISPELQENGVDYVCFTWMDVTQLRADQQGVLQTVTNLLPSNNVEGSQPFVDAVARAGAMARSRVEHFLNACAGHLQIKISGGIENSAPEISKALEDLMREKFSRDELINNLLPQKNLLNDFIAHQSDLLETAVTDMEQSNIQVRSLLNHHQNYGLAGATVKESLEQLVDAVHSNLHVFSLLQERFTEAHQQLEDLVGEQLIAPMANEIGGATLLENHKGWIASSLLENMNSLRSTVDSVKEHSGHMLEKVRVIHDKSVVLVQSGEECQATAVLLNRCVGDAKQVVEVMCKDQIVHSSIGEYISKGLNDLQQSDS